MSASNDPTGHGVKKGLGTDGLLHGKVAQLLNVRQLAINLGYKHGVAQGMHFAVLNRNAGAIHDPDTHEILGSVALAKVHVKVTTVQQEFSIADVEGKRWRSGIALPSYFFTESASVPLTLKRSDFSDVEEIEEKDSIVKIGDPVVQEQPPTES